MAIQNFVNLLPNQGSYIPRSHSILQGVQIAEGVSYDTPVRLYPDYQERLICVVPAENYSDGGSDELNPFDDWTETDDGDDNILWVATTEVGFISTIASQARVFRVDGGFVVALLKGKMGFRMPDGSVEQLSRNYGGSSEVTELETPDQFVAFKKTHLRPQLDFPEYSWDVLYDLEIRQNIYGESKRGTRFQQSGVTGLDHRRTDYFRLDGGYYQEKLDAYDVAAEEESQKERERKAGEEERQEAWLEEQHKLEVEKRRQDAQKGVKKPGTGRRSGGTSSTPRPKPSPEGESTWSDSARKIQEMFGVN